MYKRQVHEREWIMSEEDIRLELLQWLKTEKRVTAKKTGDFVNNVLLVREGGLERPDKYGLSLPIYFCTLDCDASVMVVDCAAVETGCMLEKYIKVATKNVFIFYFLAEVLLLLLLLLLTTSILKRREVPATVSSFSVSATTTAVSFASILLLLLLLRRDACRKKQTKI